MQFLRLLRPLNLLVIVLTMYAVRVFIFQNLSKTGGFVHEGEPLDFFLLVFSTVLIAAGGNIINDYFDVKADRVNKPHRLIIGKFVKPRWAIVTHWTFNFIAFAIAIYLSWRYHTFWYVFVHLLTINALWFYSMYFKRRFLIGNLMIAGLTALVPILCGIHFYIQAGGIQLRNYLPSSWYATENKWLYELYVNGLFVFILASFAFALNFVREIVKDMQDVPGDLLLGARTLPIVLGEQRSKWIVTSLIGLLTLASAVVIYNWNVVWSDSLKTALIPLLAIGFLSLLAVFFVIRSTDRRSLKKADFSLKLAMMVGCCLPYYWYFLL